MIIFLFGGSKKKTRKAKKTRTAPQGYSIADQIAAVDRAAKAEVKRQAAEIARLKRATRTFLRSEQAKRKRAETKAEQRRKQKQARPAASRRRTSGAVGTRSSH